MNTGTGDVSVSGARKAVFLTLVETWCCRTVVHVPPKSGASVGTTEYALWRKVLKGLERGIGKGLKIVSKGQLREH